MMEPYVFFRRWQARSLLFNLAFAIGLTLSPSPVGTTADVGRGEARLLA